MTHKTKFVAHKDNLRLALAALGLTGMVTGCSGQNLLVKQVNAQAPTTATPTPTLTPSPTRPLPTPTPPPTATPTPWPTLTPVPTATPWTAPVAWKPASLPLPVLEPLPVVPTRAVVAVTGLVPVSYSPPDGIDVFGGVLLRWEYGSELAEDEWFDIKIKPFGSNDSVFVDWSKTKEYNLNAWAGWTPGLYTWQIGLIKGYKEGDTKHFVADTGRDSQPFTLKWQSGGGSSGDGGSSGGAATGNGGQSGGS